jgi:phosphate:Na+ symporter
MLDSAANPVLIALFHTMYKLIFGVAMLPLSGLLERLVCMTVKDEGKQKQILLDERLMTTPAIALAQAQRVTVETALMCQQAYDEAVSLLDKWDDKKAQHVRDLEKAVDDREDELGSYLVKLSGLSLTETENRQLSTILHTISDFERISDHAVGIIISIRASMDSANTLSSSAKTELKKMASAVSEALSLCIASFSTSNIEAARRVEPLEEVVDALGEELKDHHIDRLKSGSCSVESGFIFTDLISNLSRVSDHCSNVAACIVEMQHGAFDTHKYVHRVHHSGDSGYVSDFDYFSRKYSL